MVPARRLTLDDEATRQQVMPQSRVAISADSRYVAFAIGTRESLARPPSDGANLSRHNGQITVVDLESNTSIVPTAAASWAPSWSSDGRLAFLAASDDGVGCWIWSRDSDLIQVPAPPLSSSNFGLDAPQWLPGGDAVVLLLASDHATAGWEATTSPQSVPEAVGFDVLNFDPDTPAAPGDALRGGFAPIPAPCLAVVSLTDGSCRRLGSPLHVDEHVLSPDGNWIAVHGPKQLDPRSRRVGFTQDLILVDVPSGDRRVIVHGLELQGTARHLPAWAPDSRTLASVTSDGLALIDVASSTVRHLPLSARLRPDLLLWNRDGSALAGADSSNLSSIDPRSGECTKLAVVQPLRRHGTSVLAVDSRDRWLGIRHDGHASHVVAIDPASGREEALLESDGRFVFGAGHPINGAASDIDPDGRRAVVTLDRPPLPSSLVVVDVEQRRVAPMPDLNPHVIDVQLGSWRSIAFTSAGRTDLAANVLMPPGETECPLPTVVSLYPGTRHAQPTWDLGASVVQPQLLAARGYAFVVPELPADAPGSFATPTELLNVVPPLLDALVELGIADPARLGVIGHSAGGQAVNLLITLTDRFRVAVSSAGMADLVSSFGNLRILPGGAWGAFPVGRGGLGAPWQAPERFLESSAVFHLDEVRTPLLLIHGTEDATVRISQAEEMFVGLTHARKAVRLIRYKGEGHVPAKFTEPNWRHVNEMVIDWLDTHLQVPQTTG